MTEREWRKTLFINIEYTKQISQDTESMKLIGDWRSGGKTLSINIEYTKQIYQDTESNFYHNFSYINEIK